ncbi:MAG: SDR family oxidoreductase [Syntrophobacteraceae bacterium]|jgi:uncharacterized protein YbjT (DUF2867 family)
MERILVTGATGQAGSAVAKVLADRGIDVRAATRKTTRIKWTDRVQPVAFDFEDPGLHKAALDQISGLFLIAPPLDFEAPAKLIPFIDRAREMKVRHVVFNSALGADKVERSPLRIIEQHLKKSGLAYTILRPNFFMENFSTGWAAPMIESGEISVAAGDARTSFISVSDIAEVAAVVFERKLHGAEYDLTGPEALSYGQAVEIISDVCGRTVTYHPISETEMMQNVREQGMPESAIQYIVQLFALVRKGLMAEITDKVREVTGRTPISFKEFALNKADICRVLKAA